MKILKKIREDEVIAYFLKTEIASERFKKKILSTSKKLKQSRGIIDSPNLEDVEENQTRRAILTGVRTSTLYNFPTDLEWYKALLTKEELKKVKYIDYSYWNELSKGTRLVSEGAKSVKEGVEIFGEPNDGFIKAAEYLKLGGTFPEVILVAENKVIVGFSSNIVNWV